MAYIEWILAYYLLSDAGRGDLRLVIDGRTLRRVRARWTLYSLIIQSAVFTNIFLLLLPQGHAMTVVTAICAGVSFALHAHLHRFMRV